MAEPVTVPPTAAPPSPVRARIAPAAVLSVTLLGTNALAYVFTMLAARLLAPAAYGELAALMGVLLVGVVPATGLQTAAALHLGARRAASVFRLTSPAPPKKPWGSSRPKTKLASVTVASCPPRP